MFKAIKAACGVDDALWLQMLSAWWLIVKQSDSSSRTTFDTEWARLCAMLDRSTVTGKTMDSARAWLAKMAKQREMWAYRWTWQWFTMGIHSTQRIESLHAHIMGYLRANMLLVDLVPKLEAFGGAVAGRAETRDFRHMRLELSAAKAGTHPLIDQIASIIHPFPLQLFKAQLQQSAYYSVAPGPEEGTFIVTRAPIAGASATDVVAEGDDVDVGLDTISYSAPSRLTTLGTCTCQFDKCYGLPCKHILRVCDVQQKPVAEELFSKRWRFTDDARVRELVEELQRRRPTRAAAPAAMLNSDDRFALIMQFCRPLGELAAADASLYERGREGVAQLIDELRKPARVPAAARGRAAVALPAEAEAARREDQCHACWAFGHRRRNRDCPRFGLAPLEKPAVALRAPPVVLRRKRPPIFEEEEEEEEETEELGEEEEDSEAEDTHENVCHSCSSVGTLYCCSSDGCRHAYCGDCLVFADLQQARLNDDWRCPICTGKTGGRAIGNPRQAPHKACGKERARKRSRADPTPAAGRAAKRIARARAAPKLRYR
jgi:hypothetical protein